MSPWLVLALVGAGTYVLRASMFLTLGDRPLPARIAGPLTLVGPAAVAALLGGMVFTANGAPTIDSIPTIAATSVAFVTVRRTGNVVHAFLVGLPAMWLATAVGL